MVNVTTLFFPTNTTTVLQIMDQGVNKELKHRYKWNLLCYSILKDQTSLLHIPEIVKQLTNKDVVYWSAQPWEVTNKSSLVNVRNKLYPPPPSSDPATTLLRMKHLQMKPLFSSSTIWDIKKVKFGKWQTPGLQMIPMILNTSSWQILKCSRKSRFRFRWPKWDPTIGNRCWGLQSFWDWTEVIGSSGR